MQMDALTLSAVPKLVAEKQKRTEACFIQLMADMKDRAREGFREAYLINTLNQFQNVDKGFIIKELKRLGFVISDHYTLFVGEVKDGLIRW